MLSDDSCTWLDKFPSKETINLSILLVKSICKVYCVNSICTMASYVNMKICIIEKQIVDLSFFIQQNYVYIL